MVDALDECSELHVREVVKFLEELSLVAVGANVTLKLCLSGRHYPTISIKKSLQLIVEEKEEHDKDIARYVRDNLTKRDICIESEIQRKAVGVVWVVLVVAMLNRAYDEGRVETMQQKLRELPSDLERVFETLVCKGNPGKYKTISLLQWVLFARRMLKPEELYFAWLERTQRNWEPGINQKSQGRISSDESLIPPEGSLRHAREKMSRRRRLNSSLRRSTTSFCETEDSGNWNLNWSRTPSEQATAI
ncbi:hypothetical protein BCR34DRAFT_603506 [Clohesyomyces aquaticus]|uniref:NACHT domain-containing protein n=1 Tax=Clohesyomyces aquaticus TaxID=1231657 RepID=A0A1Y1ZEZ5_9PLEO|nr:hypothetical protein BCR34DRAFT_603506 [Clohesyomyces aquaticus]